jgi:uncharacterized protein
MRRKYIVGCIAVGCAGLISIAVWAHARMSETRMLDEGIVALKNEDYARAIAVLAPLSDSGNTAARDSLGFLYAFGLGVPRDRQRAVALFVASGSSDLPERYFWIGRELEEGKLVTKDEAEARAWFKLAAEAGHLQARARFAASK